jgi:hypothetical protein
MTNTLLNKNHYKQVNETLGITIKLIITFQVSNFIKQILLFLAYGGSSIVKNELNPFSHVKDNLILS